MITISLYDDTEDGIVESQSTIESSDMPEHVKPVSPTPRLQIVPTSEPKRKAPVNPFIYWSTN